MSLFKWFRSFSPSERDRVEQINNFFDRWQAVFEHETSKERMQQKLEFYKPYFDYYKGN